MTPPQHPTHRTPGSPPIPSEARLHGRRILACLDRSASSEACVSYAVSLAKSFECPVTLMHVMPSPHGHSGPWTPDALSWEIARQEAHGYLERLGEEASAALGRRVEVRLEQGHPVDRIVDVAHEIGAGVTVLGSRGNDGVSARTHGTTVQRLLVVAQTSVFVAHGPPVPQAAAAPKRILVPLDGSTRSESVLPTAVHLASIHGASLCLVHVVQEPLVTALLAAPEEMELAQLLATRLESSAKRYLGRLQDRLAQQGTPVSTVVHRHAND